MRLFIAVNFDPLLKDALYDTVQRLQAEAVSGNFTRRENFHLTLAFLGETPSGRVSAVRRAMEAVLFQPFDLHFQKFGWFHRPGGDLYWLGADRCPPLMDMQAKLCEALRREGFRLEDRPFQPHLTLGRQVRFSDGFDRTKFEKSLPDCSARVDRISLMKSERIQGALTYTEIASHMAG